jgi:site-specific DNA-cytosine methylase
LQGFPDGWTKDGLSNTGEQVAISDTQRYKCLGNAVTTNVIEAIGRSLAKELTG